MVDANSLFVELKEIMADLLEMDISEIDSLATINSKLRDDLGIDSVESLDFLTAIENRYSIHISDEEAPRLETVKDVIDLIIIKKN